MLKTETQTIGNLDFKVTQLGFSKTRKTALLITKVAGPTITGMVKDVAESAKKKRAKNPQADLAGVLGGLDSERVLGAVVEAISDLTDSDLDTITKTFAASTQFGPAGQDKFRPLQAEDMELAFGGDGFLVYFKWLAFAVRVNYSGFFAGLSAQSPSVPS